jgi:hypothetical protein
MMASASSTRHYSLDHCIWSGVSLDSWDKSVCKWEADSLQLRYSSTILHRLDPEVCARKMYPNFLALHFRLDGQHDFIPCQSHQSSVISMPNSRVNRPNLHFCSLLQSYWVILLYAALLFCKLGIHYASESCITLQCFRLGYCGLSCLDGSAEPLLPRKDLGVLSF